MSEFLGPLLAENFLSEIANAGPEAQATALVNLGLTGVDTTSGTIAIAVETSRAEGVEATLSAAITAETTRARAAEILLAPMAALATYVTKTSATSLYQPILNFVPYNANNPLGYQTAAQVTAIVTTETSRATTAESALSSNLSIETTRAQTAEGLLAPRNSPILTGIPIAPTASAGTNSTQVATTAFVTTAVAAGGGGSSSLDITTPGSTVARSVATRFGETLDVLDYGADPSGATDSEPAFAAAQQAGQNRGGAVINIPPGTYDLASTVYTISSNTWVIGPNVTFTGSGGMLALTDGVANVGMTFGKYSGETTGASTVFISQFAGESGATASYEKNGLYVRVVTGDPSTGNLNLDMVAAEFQAQIGPGNLSGRAWAADFITTVDASGDGYAVGLELAIENFGVYQPLIDQTNSKLGISLFASGSVNSTVALAIHSAGAEWVDGIFIKDTGIQNNALRVVTNSGSSWVDVAHIDRSGNILAQGLVVENTATFDSAVSIGGALSVGAVTTGYTALSANAGGLIQIGAPATASGTPTLQFWGSSITSEPSVQVINDAAGHLSIINSGGGGANITVGGVATSGALTVNNNGAIPASTGTGNGGAGLALTWNASNGQAESDFIAYRTAGQSGGIAFLDSIASSGTYTVMGTLSPAGVLTLGGNVALTTTAIPASDTQHLLGATGTAGLAGAITLGTNLYLTGGTLNATGSGGSTSTPPVTYTFTVVSIGQSVTLVSVPNSWSALYVNGLRQDASMYSTSGSTLTLNAEAAHVGDAIIFDYTSS